MSEEKSEDKFYKANFEDEFAPSAAAWGSKDEEEIKTLAARLLSYNTHTASDALPVVLFAASELGCPPVAGALSIDAPTRPEFEDRAISKAVSLAQSYAEQSVEWLILSTYLNYLILLKVIRTGGQLSLVADQMLVVGATCREIELTILNKKDALKAKKQNRALGQGNEGRTTLNLERKLYARAWRKHASEVLSVLKRGGSKSAIAGHILSGWDKVGHEDTRPVKPSKKTVQNWLSEIPSRARSSAGQWKD